MMSWPDSHVATKRCSQRKTDASRDSKDFGWSRGEKKERPRVELEVDVY